MGTILGENVEQQVCMYVCLNDSGPIPNLVYKKELNHWFIFLIDDLFYCISLYSFKSSATMKCQLLIIIIIITLEKYVYFFFFAT